MQLTPVLMVHVEESTVLRYCFNIFTACNTGLAKFMKTHILTWFLNKHEEIENLLQQLIAK